MRYPTRFQQRSLWNAATGVSILVIGVLLVGLLWLTVVAGPRLLRSEERKKLLDTTQSAWKSFRGGG